MEGAFYLQHLVWRKKTVGKIDFAPLAIYSFPFNGTFAGMGTTLASCPESLSVSLPLFSTNTITYVRWDPNSGDVSPLRLHQESLLIPPPVVMNHTAINGLDELYQFYDRQLSATLDEADNMIDQIEVTSESTVAEYIAHVACVLSIVNAIVFYFACQCFHRLTTGRWFVYQAPESLPVYVVSAPSQSRRIRKDYSSQKRRSVNPGAEKVCKRKGNRLEDKVDNAVNSGKI